MGRPGPGESQMGQGGEKRGVSGVEKRGGGTQEVREDQGASLWPVSFERVCNTRKVWEAQKHTLERLTKTAHKDFAFGRGDGSSAEEQPKWFERQREEKASTSVVSAQLFLLTFQSTSSFLFTNEKCVCLGFCYSAQCLVQLMTQTRQPSETGDTGRTGLGLRCFHGLEWALNWPLREGYGESRSPGREDQSPCPWSCLHVWNQRQHGKRDTRICIFSSSSVDVPLLIPSHLRLRSKQIHSTGKSGR